MDAVDSKLKVIVFKACHLAAWSDSKLTSDERRYLSHLTEVMCESEAEREVFRDIRLQEVNEGLLISEIKGLSKEEKEYILDTCLHVLGSDRNINISELRFLHGLRITEY